MVSNGTAQINAKSAFVDRTDRALMGALTFAPLLAKADGVGTRVDSTREERIPVWSDPVMQAARDRLTWIENAFQADALTVISPIYPNLEHQVREAVENRQQKRNTLLVILDTDGGVVEVAERIARVFRRNYQEVKFLVADKAMSAGTILVMSGDAILMDYHSVLGPIDPQVYRDGRLIPALGYLTKYEELAQKAAKGQLTTPDAMLLNKLDLAEMHQFELARELSTKLLIEWLTTYKFKDWKKTESRGVRVTKAMRVTRARQIALALNDTGRWGSHGRGIAMETLDRDLKLKIDDFGNDPEVQRKVWNYLWFLRDFMQTQGVTTFIFGPHLYVT